MTAIYVTKGQLTNGGISADRVADAQAYLTHDYNGDPRNMQQYLDAPLREAVVLLRWRLESNGLDWSVEAICNRELTDAELKQLGDEVSGQNSDGLGEGFEQQPFAEGEREDDGYYDDNDEWVEEDDFVMVSFDWQTNDHVFTRIV